MSKSITLKLAALCFAAFCTFTVVRLQFKNNDINNDLREAEEQLEEKQAEIDALRDELATPDEEYIEKEAKKMGYHYSNEKIFYSGN